MNDNREFDELARRKLDERSFSFEEGHWDGVERTLKAQRRRGRRGWWLVPAVALLLVPAALLLRNNEQPVAPAAHVIGAPALAEERTATADVDHRSEVRPELTAATSATVAPRATQADVEQVSAATTPSARAQRNAVHAQLHERPTHHATAPRSTTEPGPRGDADRSHRTDVTDNITNNAVPTAQPTIAATVAEPAPSTNLTDQPSAASTAMTSTPIDGEASEPATAPGNSTDANTTTSLPNSNSTSAVVFEPPAVASDSLATPPASIAPLAQPEAKAVGNWGVEFSALGGMLNTTQAYTPHALLDPRSTSEGALAAAAGAEGMWMRPHWGFGVGLHYTTFAERINSERLATTSTDITYHYAVQSVETTLVVVTGTYVLDSVTYYTTTLKDTVLHVLTIDRDTVTTTIQKRAARQLMNTVSYLEIPLLVDAHTSAGRFTFGVRGGPTIGFLQQQHAALPNLTEDGYNELRRDQLRSTVLGYQARLYVRYRLCDAWSIGLEPVVRGQWGAMFGDALPVSKAAAYGAYLSVSYRLR